VVGPAAASYIANVTATTGCRWTSVSNDPWISITAGANSTGSGTFTFAVTSNTAGTRSGTITVAGFTYTVTQTTNDLSVDSDGDGVPDAIEPDEGLNYLVKDNDVFTSNRLFVMQLYRDYLEREGEEAGISGWVSQMNDGLSRDQVADTFQASNEFLTTVPPVIRLYIGILNRYPDYPLWLGNVQGLRAGIPLAVIAQIFIDSAEFQSLHGNSLSNEQFVQVLYQNVLNRIPSQGEVDGWVSVLNGGATRGQVLKEFTESPEFVQQSEKEVFVLTQYLCLLRRTPSTTELNPLVTAMNNGATRLNVIHGFLNSAEYHSRVLP
jgi:hypothetical protein